MPYFPPATSGSGDVVGPASATDNAVARFNSTTGKLVQNSDVVVDDDANLTLSVPSGVQETKGGVNLTHTDATGTSQYRIAQDDYDMMSIKRTGDTTGDGDVWTLVQIKSPQELSDTADSEATLSLTTRGGSTSGYVRTLDVYNDEYSRDNGMGLRQLYKNVTANPIRFELHDKTTNNGAWTMTGVSVTSGSPNGSYTSSSGVTPAAEDWIWDNAGTYFADDTKILSIDTGAKTFVLNRNATGTSAAVSARGKNIREIARFTKDRQLLVRKYIPASTSNVAEFGGNVAVDGAISSGGIAVPTISSTNTLTNKRITKRTGTATSSATPTINTDNVDMYIITAQAVDITSFTTNLSGTPTEGQTLWIAITGTAARGITWGSSFEASTVALPTTTVSTNRLDVGFVWNSATSKWRCIASA